MGSSSSQVELPPGMKVVGVQGKGKTPKLAQRTKDGGFKEVQFEDKKKDDSDFHSMVNQMQREKTEMGYEQPSYAEDDLVLETFHHRDGNVYQCLYQNKERFYLDSWQTQDWEPFPKQWYKKGILITDRIMKSDGSGVEGDDSGAQTAAATDDREGFVMHPDRGEIPTYIFEEKRNIHCFYDQDTGNWVRMPISWELRSELIQKLISPIEEALPDWKDRHDILAALRLSNYDPHDCISTYMAVGDKGHIPAAKSEADVKLIQEKEERIALVEMKFRKLRKKFEKATTKLKEEIEAKETAERQVQSLQEQVSNLQVTASNATVQLEALQRNNERPKTAKSFRSQSSASINIDPETLNQLNEIAKQVHREHIKLKMEAEQKFRDLQLVMKQVCVGVGKIEMSGADNTAELEDLKEMYRKEAVQRKLLYNQLQEMRGNIRVFCRCRYDERVECCFDFPSDQEIKPQNGGKKMKFDRVFNIKSTQDDVFADTKPIIASCVDGYNVCILAYGQTGAGKTHTMMGPDSDPGVNIRSISELLRICNERDNVDYTLKASMVEIYNETIVDLLVDDVTTLEIRTLGNRIVIPGMSDMFVENVADIKAIMALGDKHRSVASTKMNSTSSRSHLIFMITVEGKDKGSGAISTGTLTLCDLAGSERVGKTEATGQRLVEAAAINKSLSALGQVFKALRSGQLHVPYRNSKLTHILQPSLGGDAKACLFVAISPSDSNLPESMSTLKFGSGARQVELGEAKKNVSKRRPSMAHQAMSSNLAEANAWGVEEL